MADPFRSTPEFRKWVRQKNRWLGRVMYDGALSPTTRLVAFGIYKHLNDVSHDAWMSQETLCRKLGIGNVRTVRRSIKTLSAAGYIGLTLDPKTRSYSYEPLLISADDGETVPEGQGQSAPPGQGQSAPSPREGQGQSAPTIGAISPSPDRALRSGGQGQSAPLSNINNYTKRRDTARGSITDAIDGFIERFEQEAAEEGDGLTIEPDPIGDRWPIVQAAVVAKHGARAKTYLDQLTLQGRMANDILLTAAGSFVRDLVRQDYLDTLTAAWRADVPDINRVRIELATQRAAQ